MSKVETEFNVKGFNEYIAKLDSANASLGNFNNSTSGNTVSDDFKKLLIV